jgi:hypothetical protein
VLGAVQGLPGVGACPSIHSSANTNKALTDTQLRAENPACSPPLLHDNTSGKGVEGLDLNLSMPVLRSVNDRADFSYMIDGSDHMWKGWSSWKGLYTP